MPFGAPDERPSVTRCRLRSVRRFSSYRAGGNDIHFAIPQEPPICQAASQKRPDHPDASPYSQRSITGHPFSDTRLRRALHSCPGQPQNDGNNDDLPQRFLEGMHEPG